jgi:Xaa-Pro aminopeptidase
MDHSHRRSLLGSPLEGLGLDALLVTRLVNVRYLTGFTGSNGQLLASPDGGAFLTDSRYQEQAAREAPDVERQVYPKRFVEALADQIRKRSIHRLGFESASLSHKSWTELAGIDGLELVPTEDVIERLRWVKDADEIALIERAQAATDDAFDRVTQKLAEGVTELEVAFELEAAMRDAGSDALGFPTIVAFGENAAEPHHGPGDRPLAKGDVVKLDFGARVGGYHSDMTRTVAFGEPDPRIKEIHEVVLAAQEAGSAAVRAGVLGGAPDRAAREVIEDAGYGEQFGHSLGHGIGLEVHEGPSLRADCKDVLPEGTVITVEPGIYIPGLGGVRIEDMVLVQSGGCWALPRTTKELLTI